MVTKALISLEFTLTNSLIHFNSVSITLYVDRVVALSTGVPGFIETHRLSLIGKETH